MKSSAARGSAVPADGAASPRCMPSVTLHDQNGTGWRKEMLRGLAQQQVDPSLLGGEDVEQRAAGGEQRAQFPARAAFRGMDWGGLHHQRRHVANFGRECPFATNRS